MTTTPDSIDKILEEAQNYIDDDEIKAKARRKAKAQLIHFFEGIIPAEPVYPELNEYVELVKSNDHDGMFAAGFKAATDVARAKLKALGGGDE